MFIKALSGIPFSITAHGQDFMADLGHAGLLEAICQEAAFIVAVSDFSRELLVRACPSAEGKIHRVHNGIDLEKFRDTAGATPGAQGRILSVGRLVPIKGHAHLIAACTRLRAAGVNFHCTIVGDGPERPALQAAIDRDALGGSVVLTGSLPQEEVARRLRECDVFALSSVVDSQGATDILPTVVLEAMASGRAVLSTCVGGLAELVEHGRTGLLVPPGDDAAFAAALGTLLADRAGREAMGRAGRAKAEAEFSLERSAGALRELFARHARKPPAVLEPAVPGPSFAYLIGRWVNGQAALCAELRAVRPAVIIGRVPESYAPDPEDEPVLVAADFLPDGMVLEAEWQQQRELARRLELWRNELSIDGDEYLTQARWALHLRQLIEARGLRHLHVAGSEALPCAWMLRRLCGVTLSATVEAKPMRPLAQLRQLTADCLVLRTLPKRSLFPLRKDHAAQMSAWAERLSEFGARRSPPVKLM